MSSDQNLRDKVARSFFPPLFHLESSNLRVTDIRAKTAVQHELCSFSEASFHAVLEAVLGCSFTGKEVWSSTALVFMAMLSSS